MGTNNLLTSNLSYSNAADGIDVDAGSGSNTLIADSVYSNSGHGLYTQGDGAVVNTCAACNIGYSSTSVSLPDSQTEIDMVGTDGALILRNSPINPAQPINLADFASGTALVNYSTNTGIVQMYGDYQLAGSTLTVDYANRLYTSTATAPQQMFGSNAHTITSVVTFDASTLNELITVTATSSSQWSVAGSSSGVLNASFSCSAGGHCGFTSTPVNFTLNPAATVTAGDSLNFATLAASSDLNQQKKLQFAAITGSGFNNGRSKIEIGNTSGFHAVGVSTAPTSITMLTSGGTYYTFVDSGAFTVDFASMTNMDESGVQLWYSSGVFSINNSTFDYSGSGIVSTSTLFTLNSVTQSTITLVGVTYGSSRANTKNYNYTISGSSTGLSWTNESYTGALTGPSHERNDTAGLIHWSGTDCSTITSVQNGGWSVGSTWNIGIVPTSCNPVVIASGTTVTLDSGLATASTTTINGYLQASRVANSTLTVVGGNIYVNSGGTLDMGTSASPINASSATLILAYGASAGQYGLIVNPGGNFLVFGNTKTPWTPLSSPNVVGPGTTGVPFTVANATGWQIGDTITIDTETAVITNLSGNQVTITQGLGQAHVATFPVVVANLTRNVVVRSSGTDVGVSDAGNSAYIENLVTNATSFNLTYGDFQYLGNYNCATNGCNGIDFDGLDSGPNVTGSISSSTVRNGNQGIDLYNAGLGQAVLTSNVIFNMASVGINIAGDPGNNTLASNVVYSSGKGIQVVSSNNTLLSNVVFGINTSYGILVNDQNNLLVSNLSYKNEYQILLTGLQATHNVLIANSTCMAASSLPDMGSSPTSKRPETSACRVISGIRAPGLPRLTPSTTFPPVRTVSIRISC